MTNTLWKPNKPVTGYFFCAGATGLWLIILLDILFNGPSETGIFLGLSAERLILLGGMLTISIILAYIGIQIIRGKSGIFEPSKDAKHSQRLINLTLMAASLVFLFAWLIIWTPADHFGKFYYYIQHITPFLVWLTCFSATSVVLLMANHFGVNGKQFSNFIQKNRILFGIAGAALLVFAFIAVTVMFRVVNMRWQDEDFWYGAGVPLLSLQVFLAIALSITSAIILRKFQFIQKLKNKAWLDLFLFTCIWAVAAWLWANEPVNPDFFITQPAAPNFESYPDYDAKFFDIISQYALIGQGLNNNYFYDRPLYPALLTYLHAFAGQNYNTVVALQAALYAIFPALGYLLGKRLHSREAGMGLAVLLTLRGMNALEIGQFINTSHQKQMMTDFPTAILIMMMSLFLVRWLQEPGKNWLSLGAAAGILGLGTLLRPHPLIYIPVLIALIIWIYRQQKRLWPLFSSMVLVVAFAGVLPWTVSNGQGRSVMDMYLERIRTVIDRRYQAPPSGGSKLLTPIKVAAIENPHRAQINQLEDKSILAFSIDHFLNNLTTTVQILPYTLAYDNPRDTVKNGENFWKSYWDGSLSPWAKILLPVNLILIALGLGAAWKRARVSGLIPLLMMLAYYTMNALARTSGGRYIVPVDWIVIIYYFWGILTLIEIATSFFRINIFPQVILARPPQINISLNRAVWSRMFGILFLFITIGASVPLAGNFSPKRYTATTRKELAQQFMTQSGSKLGISSEQLNKFLISPGSVILQGRTLYPRPFEKDTGFDVSIYSFYHSKPYPRMIFTLLGPYGEAHAILPTTQTILLPNVSDAIILGCQEKDSIQIWAVSLRDSNQLIKRTPAPLGTSLTCPLSEPICDNNHHCK